MDKFKLTNTKIQNIIVKYYRSDEDIYRFQEKINGFFEFVENNFNENFKFDVKSDEELFNLPVEETYKLIENQKINIEKETSLILNITAYKIKLYLELVLKGLNENNIFPYFPNVRAILEHTCFSYKILFESKNYLDLMNIRKEKSEEDIIAFIQNYGKAQDILRLFIFGTKNKDLIEDGIKDNRVDNYTAYKSIEYVSQNTEYIDLLDTYKYFSELTHPSSYSTNYFLKYNEKSSQRLVNSTLINQNKDVSNYSLQPDSEIMLAQYFKYIIYLILDCIELFEVQYSIFNKFEIKLPNCEILKNVNIKKEDDVKRKEFLESNEYFNELKSTVKKNKFKSPENIDKETEKIIKKNEHEIRKNKKQ